MEDNPIYIIHTMLMQDRKKLLYDLCEISLKDETHVMREKKKELLSILLTPNDRLPHLDINKHHLYDSTPLYYATEHKNLDTVEFLLKLGADPNIKSTDKHLAPLHLASWYGNLDIVKLLIEKGANVNIRNTYGITPLRYVISHYDMEINSKIDIVETLIEKGANINSKKEENMFGNTPLSFAEKKLDRVSLKHQPDLKRIIEILTKKSGGRRLSRKRPLRKATMKHRK